MRILLAILALVCATMGYFIWRAPRSESINATVDGINDITLVAEGFVANERPRPVMGLGYAQWANFRRISSNGETYTQVGSGASVVRKGVQPTRYVVREVLWTKHGTFGPQRYASLLVEDTKFGKVLGMKEWLCRRDECEVTSDDAVGWQGQHAALFVRRVLNPEMATGGAIGVKPYPKTVFRVKQVSPSVRLGPEELKSRTSMSCSPETSIFLRRDINRVAVSNGSWTFVPQRNASQVFCFPEVLLVISGGAQDGVHLDLISPDGALLGQFQASLGRFPVSDGGTYQYVADASVSERLIRLRLLHFHKHWPKPGEKAPAEWETLVEVDRAESEGLHRGP